MKQNKKKMIGIFGYFGAWNLGDEAVVGVLIQNIRKRWPDAEIHAICLNPDNAQSQHGITGLPLRRLGRAKTENPIDTRTDAPQSLWRRMLIKVIRRLSVIAPEELVFITQSMYRLRDFDMLVVGGSGQLIDNEGGPWNHPYNHFKWSLMAKLLGIRFVFMSVGAGPIQTKLGKYFLRHSLSMATYRSFRDNYSKDLVEGIGVQGKNEVYPDQAFCIEPNGLSRENERKHSRTIVGIAPIAYCDPRHWSEHKQETFVQYRDKLTEFVQRLLEKECGVVFFHTQVHGDDVVVDEIMATLAAKCSKKALKNVTVHPVSWYPDAFKAIAKTDIVVASRFHAVIFSYVLSRPVLGISYDPKIDNVMAAIGQGGNVLNIETFEVDELIKRFEILNKRRQKVKVGIQEKVRDYRAQLQRQYDVVLQ